MKNATRFIGWGENGEVIDVAMIPRNSKKRSCEWKRREVKKDFSKRYASVTVEHIEYEF